MNYIFTPLLSLFLFGLVACSHFKIHEKRLKFEPKMEYIQGGSFLMGSPATEPDRDNDERQHSVKVNNFMMAKTEVTIAQWKACAKDGGCTKSQPYIDYMGNIDIKTPIQNVNLNDVEQFIHWLNNKTGKHYRLPTEAEWEYAARAGTTTPFPWGGYVNNEWGGTTYPSNSKHNVVDNGKAHANCGQCRGEMPSPLPVGSFPAYWGLHDMHGNVSEMTCSVYDKNYSNGSELKCAAPNDKRPRVIRGGSYESNARDIRSAARRYIKISETDEFRGFRLARSL